MKIQIVLGDDFGTLPKGYVMRVGRVNQIDGFNWQVQTGFGVYNHLSKSDDGYKLSDLNFNQTIPVSIIHPITPIRPYKTLSVA